MDYSSVSKIKSKLKFVKPEAVINCIGLTNIEECENKPEFAFEANVEIAGKIAKACFESNIKFVHISTDHLYNGLSAFTSEEDDYSPLNYYAKTKGQGEKIVLVRNKDAIVIRTNFLGGDQVINPHFQIE